MTKKAKTPKSHTPEITPEDLSLHDWDEVSPVEFVKFLTSIYSYPGKWTSPEVVGGFPHDDLRSNLVWFTSDIEKQEPARPYLLIASEPTDDVAMPYQERYFRYRYAA